MEIMKGSLKMGHGKKYKKRYSVTSANDTRENVAGS
jgi:hypothetical protein